jgi:hypothetical protein
VSQLREGLAGLWRFFRAGADRATGKTAVMMVTHRLDAAILAHFARLKRECGLPAFLAYHCGRGPRSLIVDLNVTNGDVRAVFPLRYWRMRRRRRKILQGYCDIVTFTAALKPKLADFQWIWIVEYDVDFTGLWSDFFAGYAESTADVLLVHIRRRSEDPGWCNWRGLGHPPGVEEFAGFTPMSRVSRRFLEAYWAHMRSGAWAGHVEAVVPTFAASQEMTMEDLLKSDRRGCIDPSTFVFLPVQSTVYFHERPEAFAKRDALYHPIKPSAPTG